MQRLPLEPLDIVALATFFVVWIGYSALFDGILRRPRSINSQMLLIREAWMLRLLSRGIRIMDATLIGHAIHSATFFASTTIILLAGLVGVIGSAERVHSTAVNLSILFGGTTQGQFELKVFLLIAIYVYAFLKFTWAIRQLNYFCSIIGSAPETGGTPANPAMAKRMAILLTQGIWQFNSGIRAHYFALAALGWMVHPVLFLLLTLLMPALLVRRQLSSTTARLIVEQANDLASVEDKPSPPSAHL
ncbi:MAG: DUF599 family protein [Rhodospirillales bacterium]|nr:DUF599 family protein [Rhodospirillales bacterium]